MAVQFPVGGLPVGRARKGKERERKKKCEISLTLSLGSHLPHQKDLQVTLWGDSHGGELRSLKLEIKSLVNLENLFTKIEEKENGFFLNKH